MIGRFHRDEQRPLVYGHRGTCIGKPENTLAAMRRALEQGADGVEVDVRLAADGELVVIHDADLERVGGRPLRVADCSVEQLADCDLGEGQGVPTLDQAFETVLGAGALLNVELKVDRGEDGTSLVDAVLARVNQMSADECSRLLLSSFDRPSVERLCDRLPDVAVAWLFSKAVSGFPAVQGLHPHHELVVAEHVELAHEAGLFVNAWTVNEVDEAARLADADVDGIITDDVPAILGGF